jgi:type I restriction-modification system DNA methylase subunit
MHVIPDKVRHSLGEFYTPPWLADNLVNRAIELAEKDNWKALDPCCGSGTFVTVLIRLVLEKMHGKQRKTKLKAVLDRVRGIDLNPLAVLTARINYFINISHLIEDDDEIEIPIYLKAARASSSILKNYICLGLLEKKQNQAWCS